MKLFSYRFIPIVLLALALMMLIFIAQLFTNQSTLALQEGNLQAVETFKINNRLQTLVNIAFDLQSKLRASTIVITKERERTLQDSLTLLLGYNSNALMRMAANPSTKGYLQNLNTYIDKQVSISLRILQACKESDANTRRVLTDSLRKLQLGDSIYTNCLEVQKSLEKDLQETLITNTAQANKLSLYNRILAAVAIIAILIMTTIIIRRHSKQLQLISDLKDAQKAALRSTEVKDQFLANMSHELRTPLNALVGFGQLLSQTKLDESQKQYTSIITSSSYNLLNIVNDVLDISKIEAGKLRIDNKVFELRDLLEDIELMFSGVIAEKSLRYSYEIDERIPRFLKSDPERLKQILINLVSNAIKFTSKGTVHVAVTIIWDNDTEGRMKIGFSVRDTGAGIPADKIDSIFQRFEQLEHATTRQHGGTGLGLTIVKNLVEMLGGSISVHSDLGSGSVFTFTSLFEKVRSFREEVEEIGLRQYEYMSVDLSPYQILAVEDNRTNQLLLTSILKKYNAQPAFADNGVEALEILKKKTFGIILMDIQMPLMDGYVAARHIRNELKLTVPLVAMTAYVSKEERAKCMEAGFDAYIAKPIEEQKLIETLAIFLNIEMIRVQEQKPRKTHSKQYILELVSGDRQMAYVIIAEMQKQWLTDKAELGKAVAEKDPNAVKKVLHRLRSTLSPFGPSHEVFTILKDLEKTTSDEGINLNLIEEYIASLNKEVTSM